MSGGSFNYLCFSELPEIMCRTDELEQMEQTLIEKGYEDIAKDVHRLAEYCKSAKVRIGVLFEQLNSVLHDIEWYESGDIGDESLKETLEKYRNGGTNDD